MPRRSGHAYLVRESTGWTAFVPAIGGYFKTHWCVVVCACSSCGAPAGHPCNGAHGPTAQTHTLRRQAAKKAKSDEATRTRLREALPSVALALDELQALAEFEG